MFEREPESASLPPPSSPLLATLCGTTNGAQVTIYHGERFMGQTTTRKGSQKGGTPSLCPPTRSLPFSLANFTFYVL